MRSAVLPAAVVWLVRRVAPRRLGDGVVADLQDDYARVSGERHTWRARAWLAREVASLVAAFLWSRRLHFSNVGPLFVRDLEMAWRQARQAPLAFLGAAATLSAGLLAVLVTVGLARALLLRPVSAKYGHDVRRVAIVEEGGRAAFRLSSLEVEQVRAHLGDAARAAIVNLQPAVLRAEGGELQTMVEVVDGGYFDVIGGAMRLGRPLVSADDHPASLPVAVLSESAWRRRFGASREVIGETIRLNGNSFAVVGVMAASGSASVLGAGVDVWTTMAHADGVLNPGWRTDPEARWFAMFVLPAVSVSALDGHLETAARALAQSQPEAWRSRRLRSESGSVLTGGQRRAVARLTWMLGGLALLILVAGAANVASVLVARAAASARQTAIHLSLGAGRFALVRRLLVEGLGVGLIGGAMALLWYAWARQQLAEVALLPTFSLRLDLPLDGQVVGIVVLAAGACGLGLAAGPAVWTARVNAREALGASTRAAGGVGVSRLRRVLVSAQVGVTLALVAGAVLLTRSLDQLTRADLGFIPAGLVALDFDLAPAVAAEEMGALAAEALRRVTALPGVAGAAMASRAPIDASMPRVEVRRESAEPVVGDVTRAGVTATYFATVGIPVVAGRGFTADESRIGADVAIVNQRLAMTMHPEGDVVGRSVVVGADRRRTTVIGVARDAKYRAIAERGGLHLYQPVAPNFTLALLVRATGDPRRTLSSVQQVLDGVGPGVVGFFPRTMDDHLSSDLLPARVAAVAATGSGTLAVTLSAVGLYGLVAWLVERRRREIAVRLALGATATDVRHLVVGEAARAVAPGIALGGLLAAGFGYAARSMLVGVGPFDVRGLLAGVAMVVVVVGVAAWGPCRQAVRVDPMIALRDP